MMCEHSMEKDTETVSVTVSIRILDQSLQLDLYVLGTCYFIHYSMRSRCPLTIHRNLFSEQETPETEGDGFLQEFPENPALGFGLCSGSVRSLTPGPQSWSLSRVLGPSGCN